MKLGIIGDDFTGSSDIGLMLAESGFDTMQYVGVPEVSTNDTVTAGVISLKSRSNPAVEAVADSLKAFQWLNERHCEQILFKYCSTFDSTAQGNIGPVIDGLIDATGTTDPVIVCPAVPTVGRTIYQGHLFVFDQLLSESGLQNHPITPMTDPDIRRWLGLQTAREIGHLPLNILRAGEARKELERLATSGRQVVVCDALTMDDIAALNQATDTYRLVTGGAGLGYRPYITSGTQFANWLPETGSALVLSGSCSPTTLQQLKVHRNNGGAQLCVTADDIVSGKTTTAAAVDWAIKQNSLPVIFSSDTSEAVAAVQAKHGSEKSASAIEAFFADVARAAVGQGIRRLISAGGETSGAIVKALSATSLEIGPKIDPGVPALRVSGQNLVIALKSGNFGAPDFFTKAASILAGQGGSHE